MMKPFPILEAASGSGPDLEALEFDEAELEELVEANRERTVRPARPCVVCGAALPIGRKRTHLGACRRELRRRMQQDRRRRRR